jgi:HSP20 family molecular chaperone IbpA
MEIDYGSFRRQIRLSEPVDTAAAEATYARGLLRVVLPVAKRSSRPFRVEVTTRGAG